MKLSEYLQQRQCLNGGTAKALCRKEAELCGIPWPLRHGWPSRHADLEVDYESMSKIVAEKKKKRAEFRKKLKARKEKRQSKVKNCDELRAYYRKMQEGAVALMAGEIQPKTKKMVVSGDAFLSSYEWRVARMKVLKRDGARCCCCGATPDDGVKMHVDHIKPRRTHPWLALDLDNLQVLCEVCNHGKGNWDSTDWRKKPAANDALEEEQTAHIRSIVDGRL